MGARPRAMRHLFVALPLLLFWGAALSAAFGIGPAIAQKPASDLLPNRGF